MSYEEQEEVAEVIEDYQSALDSLANNNRLEITNLTNIARELTSHAFPIAECLEQHIKKVPPQRKLPAIYVLDSIVKNIGTPYTLFFGKNLYQTFMDAYASVDNNTRRKMEEMLKTWKEPVPGSIDRNPVFPADVVRPIENALIKARTSALQAEQERMRSQQQLLGRGARTGQPYRATPTPPNAHARQPFGQPPYPGPNGYRPESSLGQQSYPLQHQPMPYAGSMPQPPPSAPAAAAAPFQPPQGYYGASASQHGISIDSLNNDIEQLIVAVGAALGRSPQNSDIQTEVKALLTLQGLLRDKHRALPQEQLMAVRNQVDNLAVKYRVSFSRQTVTPTPPISAGPYHAPVQQQSRPVAQPVAAPMPPASAPPAPVSLDSLLGKGALAALLGRQSATPQPAVSTPQIPPAPLSALRSPIPQKAEPQKPATPDPLALLGALRGAGILPPTPQPGPASAAPRPPVATPPNAAAGGASAFPPNLASILAQARNIAASAGPVISSGEFRFKISSLKQPRPHLVSSIYEALGPPCTQCGRRFRTDEEGKRKKTAHMDWHFHVHQRMMEVELRGQHRSWFVDQADWIRSVETVDLDQQQQQHALSGDGDGSSSMTNNGAGGNASAAAGNINSSNSNNAAGPRIRYIAVPDDGDDTNTVCPICQEKFETKWLDEAQEWVWIDCVRAGGRAYHATCYAEVTKDGGGGGGGGGGGYTRATPDPVLGKRKAEDDMIALRGGKMKLDS